MWDFIKSYSAAEASMGTSIHDSPDMVGNKAAADIELNKDENELGKFW